MEEVASDSRFTDKITFIVVNTNDAEIGRQKTEQSGWNNCTHVHLNAEDKAPVVEALSIKRVPHHVMIDSQGQVLQNGKAFSWDQVEQLAGIESAVPAAKTAAPAADTADAFSFSLDEDF